MNRGQAQDAPPQSHPIGDACSERSGRPAEATLAALDVEVKLLGNALAEDERTR